MKLVLSDNITIHKTDSFRHYIEIRNVPENKIYFLKSAKLVYKGVELVSDNDTGEVYINLQHDADKFLIYYCMTMRDLDVYNKFIASIEKEHIYSV